MSSFAILTDVTRCIGCEECVLACKKVNHTGEEDAPWAWQQDPEALSATRWTTIATTPEGRYVRVHCRHCLDPACAAACPVGALHTTPEGAVVYNPTICMGCRYCMVACPFRMTRYGWESASPRVRKCILCYQRVKSGESDQPACTAACPRKATIFGERSKLLAEAHRRIEADPRRYIRHVWGEHEVGGTSVLYISDVDLAGAGWPQNLPGYEIPAYPEKVLHTVPWTFLTVGTVMAGVHWIIRRRQQLAAEQAGSAGQTAVKAETAAEENGGARTEGGPSVPFEHPEEKP